MKLKKIVSGALALALTACLAVPPAGAAGSSFSDVSGGDAVNADILRLMGVVSGTGGNRFDPGGMLTRAQFCAMVVNFMQKGDEVPQHTSRTIFSDVTASHWGLGYVNLAASLTVKDGEKQTALVSGVGDGRFQPDSQISLAEAATILIRVLGYSSKQTGTVWPQSFMALAGSIGLTDGLNAGALESITRAQAARLFVNALDCETGDGKSSYYETLGTASKGVILLAVGVETDDGTSDGAIRTTKNKESEAYLAAAGEVKPAALVGRRGALVLNSQEEIVTFVPDDSTAVTVVLSGDAKPGSITATDGKQYTMSQDTLLYTADSKDGKSYVDGYSSLYSGTRLTMYSQRGKIVAVYAEGSSSAGDGGAVVVSGAASSAIFYPITGGASDFNIVKNRQPISMSDIKPYDVATYDSLTNTLVVSDLRLSCVYESASPSAKAPSKITVLGHDFPVLDSAWETMQDARLNSQVTLLLTANGEVAGVASGDSRPRSNAIGLVKSSGSVQLFLPSGGSLDLSGTLTNDNRVGQLAAVSSSKRGQISASSLPMRGTSGVLNVKSMTMGSLNVTAGVRIYEQAGSGAMHQVELSSLGIADIPGDRVAAYHQNSSGMVDYIVLSDVTGDAYLYGMMKATTTTTPARDDKDEDGTVTHVPAKSRTTWSLINGSGELKFSPQSGYAGRNGDYVAVTVGKNSSGENTLRSVKQLTRVKDASASDFFEFEEHQYITVGGKTYLIADDVQCRQKGSSWSGSTENWFTQTTGEERLRACKESSDRFTLYVDPIAERVRIIIAE